VVKKSWYHIFWVPPPVIKISLLKDKRKFCIRNPRLFLRHFTFAWETMSLPIFFYTSMHFQIGGLIYAHIYCRVTGSFLPSAERLRVEIGCGSCKKINIGSGFWKLLEMLLALYFLSFFGKLIDLLIFLGGASVVFWLITLVSGPCTGTYAGSMPAVRIK